MMASIVEWLTPRGVNHVPQHLSPLRTALYTMIGRLTVPDWAATYGTLDWEQAAASLQNPTLTYPAYYTCDRHGVRGGYLTGWQALGWSVAARFYGLKSIYQQLAAAVAARTTSEPVAVDIGAGTGDWLALLQRRLPAAKLLAVDLSPYMLAALQQRWQQIWRNPPDVQLLHAAGEQLPLPAANVDLATALLLLHELPPQATRALFAEAWRILKPGGIFITLDAIQRPIPWPWLNNLGVRLVAAVFHEPDFRAYSRLDLAATARAAGFEAIQTMYLGHLPWKFQVQFAQKAAGTDSPCL